MSDFRGLGPCQGRVDGPPPCRPGEGRPPPFGVIPSKGRAAARAEGSLAPAPRRGSLDSLRSLGMTRGGAPCPKKVRAGVSRPSVSGGPGGTLFSPDRRMNRLCVRAAPGCSIVWDKCPSGTPGFARAPSRFRSRPLRIRDICGVIGPPKRADSSRSVQAVRTARSRPIRGRDKWLRHPGRSAARPPPAFSSVRFVYGTSADSSALQRGPIHLAAVTRTDDCRTRPCSPGRGPSCTGARRRI